MCVNYRLAKQATKVLETEKGGEIEKGRVNLKKRLKINYKLSSKEVL